MTFRGIYSSLYNHFSYNPNVWHAWFNGAKTKCGLYVKISWSSVPGTFNFFHCSDLIIDLFACRQKLLPHFISEMAAALKPSGEPAARCQIDLQQLSFLIHCVSLRVVLLWLMEDSFRGHYPDGQLEPCGDGVSLTAEWWAGGTEKSQSACKGAFLLIVRSKVQI